MPVIRTYTIVDDGAVCEDREATAEEALSMAQTLDDIIAAIDAEYQLKFAQLRADIATAMLNDGPGMDAALSALRTKYTDTWAAYSDALIAAAGG